MEKLTDAEKQIIKGILKSQINDLKSKESSLTNLLSKVEEKPVNISQVIRRGRRRKWRTGLSESMLNEMNKVTGEVSVNQLSERLYRDWDVKGKKNKLKFISSVGSLMQQHAKKGKELSRRKVNGVFVYRVNK